MSEEIEKKYLIRENGKVFAKEDIFRLFSTVSFLKKYVLKNGVFIRQGYLSLERGEELVDLLRLHIDFKFEEVRLREKGKIYYFTIKGKGDILRNEIELEISRDIFLRYWNETKGKRVEKMRLEKPIDGLILEMDVYTDNRDLIICEVEMPSIEEAESLMPFGLDITKMSQYKNKNLAK